jgi:hypothetical protein
MPRLAATPQTCPFRKLRLASYYWIYGGMQVFFGTATTLFQLCRESPMRIFHVPFRLLRLAVLGSVPAPSRCRQLTPANRRFPFVKERPFTRVPYARASQSTRFTHFCRRMGFSGGTGVGTEVTDHIHNIDNHKLRPMSANLLCLRSCSCCQGRVQVQPSGCG